MTSKPCLAVGPPRRWALTWLLATRRHLRRRSAADDCPDLMASPPEVHHAAKQRAWGPVRCWCRPRGGTLLSIAYAETADELAALLAAVAGTWDGPTAAVYVGRPYPHHGWCRLALAARAMATRQRNRGHCLWHRLGRDANVGRAGRQPRLHGVLMATNFFGINTIPIAYSTSPLRADVDPGRHHDGHQAVSTAAAAAAPQTTPAPPDRESQRADSGFRRAEPSP